MLVTTRTPTRSGSTPSPTATTTPPTPLPGISGVSTGPNGPFPARIWVSTNVMFTNAVSISACPGPATGSGASPGTSTSGPPVSRIHAARIRLSPSLAGIGNQPATSSALKLNPRTRR